VTVPAVAVPTVDPRPLRERLAALDLDRLADFHEANERLYRAGLTDGLPVMPPTARRIEEMLDGADSTASPSLGPLPPGFMTPTPWDAAACAVLAGCERGALPLVVAALAAVADPAFNLLGIQTTTGAAATLLVVNGPVAGELGINSTHNSLGPGWRPNATIGRAVRLALQTVGLAVPGSGDMATQGHPGKYTWLVAENEVCSPWAPLHATRGLAADVSAVTTVGAVGNVEVVLPLTSPEALVKTLAHSMTIAGNIGRGSFGSGQPLVLLPPESVQFLHKHGWDRANLQQVLFAEAKMPLPWLSEDVIELTRAAREEHSLPPVDAVPAARSPEDILIVVTGGVGVKATFVPTWGGGTEAVTREVEPLG